MMNPRGMRLSRLAVIIFGVVMIVGIAKGAMLLLIPIFALLIPISAIIAFSPIGHAISNSIRGTSDNVGSGVSAKEFNELKDKYDKLESRFNEYDDEMNKMREALIFTDNKKIPGSSVNSEEHKNNINKQINLEKTL